MDTPVGHRWTGGELRSAAAGMGLARGDAVMMHAALRAVGPMLGGPDVLVRAVLDVVGDEGTLLVYTDWDDGADGLRDQTGRVPEQWRAEVPPFDPASSRAIRSNGAIAELVRTFPGARRSGNPGASVAAVGGRSAWFVENHALDYGYGEQSPFAKLVETRGKVLMVGAPLDTMTLLHHAEHKANLPGKRVLRYEVPLLADGRTVWRMLEEFDTSDPVVSGLDDAYFGTVVTEFLATGRGTRGTIGAAPSVVVGAAEIVEFAVRWLESR